MKKNTLRHSLLLLLTAAIWGFAFVAQSVGMDYVQPFTFTAARSLIGGAYCFRLFLSGRRKPAGLLRKIRFLETGTARRHHLRCSAVYRIESAADRHTIYDRWEKAGLSQQCTSCLFRYSVYFFTRKPVSACGSLWHLLYADCIFYV